jgi:hypothetical protein
MVLSPQHSAQSVWKTWKLVLQSLACHAPTGTSSIILALFFGLRLVMCARYVASSCQPNRGLIFS